MEDLHLTSEVHFAPSCELINRISESTYQGSGTRPRSRTRNRARTPDDGRLFFRRKSDEDGAKDDGSGGGGGFFAMIALKLVAAFK